MPDFFDHELIKRLKNFITPGTKPGAQEDNSGLLKRERIVVFIGAYIMAVSLWFIVNLSSSFSIDINVPIELGNVPEGMALTEEMPEFVQVGVSGDGWQLMNLYSDPPTVVINIEEQEVNLFDQVRQRLNYLQSIDIAKVQPLVLTVDLEPKVSKKVPVQINTDLTFRNRFGIVGTPQISPDSITVIGAQSKIESINEWVVRDTLRMNDIREDISRTISLQDTAGVIVLSEEEINFTADVSEFTEGETIVYIETTGLPRGQNVNYNPSSITIKYDVPIEQFAEVESINPYRAYVPYSKIIDDSTGLVTPDIEQTAEQYELILRTFRPRAVSYFTVLN
ncbi:YbbR-like domain-containing protein [Gracilimonas sp.]|uniref:CdaR family protein n=1 Tax=Gracilimonas sp. TaxID=1974203 RepID=UPI0028719C1F|nr:CdaR family protein [Gracilimonas sp.]